MNKRMFSTLANSSKAVLRWGEISRGMYVTNRLSIAIVGRPNVGKSTLFNRILNKPVAIVYDEPGVTRDWQMYEGVFQDIPVRLFDTPGLMDVVLPDLHGQIHNAVKEVLQNCHGLFFLFDGKEGVTATDIALIQWLRKNISLQKIPLFLLANKCEKSFVGFSAEAEGASLGFGVPLTISALHGHGVAELGAVMKKLFASLPSEETLEDMQVAQEESVPTLVVMGRPNVGKSTFINTCLGMERVLTGSQAGLTRDAVVVKGQWDGKPFRFVDTAGLRKKSHVSGAIEKMACQETYHALVFAHVVVMMIDATRGIEKQDLVILEKITQEGRAVVVALSKWDHVEDPHTTLKNFSRCLEDAFVQGKSIPMVAFSSVTQKGLKSLREEVFRAYDTWNVRLSTGPLNRWLQKMMVAHAVPRCHGRPVRIKYIEQIKNRPPTFLLHGNKMEDLPESYKRYLINGLVKDFSLYGSSPRLIFRSSDNPYHGEKDS